VRTGAAWALYGRERFGFFIFLPVIIGDYRSDFRSRKSAPANKDGTEAGFLVHFFASP